jgi:hypothetical protein
LSKSGEPEFVAVLLSGESPLPRNLMRSFLSANPEFRKITAVEGVDLFQESRPLFGDPLGGNLGVLTERVQFGPIFAHQQVAVVVGSSKDIVSMMIRRLNGKETGPSLATNKSFKDIGEQRALPGILVYADAKRLLERLDAIQKQHWDAEPIAWLAMKKLLPLSGVRTFVGRFELRDQSVSLRCSLLLDRKAASPLGDLLAGQGIALTDPNMYGIDTVQTVSLALPSGEQRLQRLLGVLDLVVKATGTLGPTASEMLKDLEDRNILSAARVAKVDRLTLALPAVSMWAKGAVPMPVLIVHADSSEALEALEASIPALLELLGGVKADPVTETVASTKIRTLEAKASPLGTTVHYARRGNGFAIGTDRKFVAACLSIEPLRKTTPINADSDRPAVVAAWNWPGTIAALGASATKESDRAAAIPGRFGRTGRFPTGSSESLLPRELLDQLQGLPPMALSLGRQGDALVLELRQSDPKGVRIKAVNRWFEAYASDSGRNGYRYRSRPVEDFAPDIVAPPPFLPPPAP